VLLKFAPQGDRLVLGDLEPGAEGAAAPLRRGQALPELLELALLRLEILRDGLAKLTQLLGQGLHLLPAARLVVAVAAEVGELAEVLQHLAPLLLEARATAPQSFDLFRRRA